MTEQTHSGPDEQKYDQIPTPEKKGLSKKQKMIMAFAGVALALVAAAGGGVAVNAMNQNRTATKTEAPINPTDEKQAIPNEAKTFVNDYGDRYKDPVSTYYSAMGYEAEYDAPLMMTDANINKYEITNDFHGEVSPLGFKMEKLPIEDKIDQAYSIKIFNEFEAKNLNLYMNLIAKNPSEKGVATIENQFLNYCAGNYLNSNNNTSNEAENIKARKILDTMKSIVEKYGSNANYCIAPAVSAQLTTRVPTSTIFSSDIPTRVRDDNSGFADSGVSILINIDVYEGKEVTHKTELLKDVQLSCERQPFFKTAKFVYLSFGQD